MTFSSREFTAKRIDPSLFTVYPIATEVFRQRIMVDGYETSVATLTNSENADALIDLALAFARTTAEPNTTIFASVMDNVLSRLARGDSAADVAAWISSLKPTEIDDINKRFTMIGETTTDNKKMDKNSETIVNLTIGDYVVPCRVTEKPDFDTDGDEPIELKWRLSCEVDDAGYKVFSQAYYGGTFCSMGVATTRGILEDVDFLKIEMCKNIFYMIK